MAPPFDFELATIENHDHDQQQYDHHHLFGNYLELPQSSFSSTTSSLSSPVFSAPAQLIQGSISDRHYYRESQDFQFHLLEADHIVASGGSRDQDQAADDQRNHESRRVENVSVKWMSSKMRIMRKMTTSTNPDQAISSVTTTHSAAPVNFSSSFSSRNFEERQKPHPSSPLGTDVSSNAPSTPIRVCSDCNTTKTPLWRSGPRGPKSLCNACGIRQRKARRAMAAAAAAANGTSLAVEPAPSLIKMSKANKLKDNKTIPFKKRCHKLNTSSSPSSRGKSKTKIRFEDFTITGVNQNNPGGPTSTTAFQPVFPQDEKEAAILLMALSCGLVHG